MPPLNGQSTVATIPGVLAENTAGGEGMRGISHAGHGAVVGVNEGEGQGVWGESTIGEGVRGMSHSAHGAVVGVNDGGGQGVWGESTQSEGVRGISHNPNHGGVVGISDKPNGIGVFGFCDDGSGSLVGTGVWGKSSQGEGVHGETNSPAAAGVAGFNLNTSPGGPGVFGESHGFDGVTGHSLSNAHAGVAGLNDNGGFGVYGRSSGSAGFFEGNVTVTGDIFLKNSDCAEDFDIAALEGVEPGSVMVIGHDSALQQSEQAYDKRVAGVVSGAGNYKPGIVLDRREPAQSRKSIALLGKVYCKVDAGYSPIEIGDLLTTSPTPGHAMKAADPFRAFGALIGKALHPLAIGQRLIPILVALQ
jgi:hypothetical protein